MGYIALIAGRIWWIHRQTLGLRIGGRSIVPAAVVIVESGAIYSTVLIILLALYLSGSFAQYVALDGVSSGLFSLHWGVTICYQRLTKFQWLRYRTLS